MEFSYLSHIQRTRDSDIPLTSHPCYEIIYYLKGSGYTVIGNNSFQYQAGTFALIPPLAEHREKQLTDTELILVKFKNSISDIPMREGVFLDSDGSILYMLKKMERDHLNQLPYYERHLNLLCGQIVLHCLRSQGRPDDDPVELSAAYIDVHFSEPLQIQMLARATGYSYHRFRHLFKEKTGLPPAKYILEKRVMAARMYLMCGDQNIAQIAEKCGFTSLSQFSKLFCEYAGMPPGAYRKFKKWEKVINPESEFVLE